MWLLNPYRFARGIALPAIGDPFQGGYYGGLISHTADGVATHALIVAPAATGASGTGYTLTTMYQWKTTTVATANTGSTFDGAANTAAMVAAGIANHPAAQFCVDLNIGGFSDWYLPAHLELEIIYFNLKPSISSNNTSTGINAYAVPPRTANYTSSIPARTLVAAFQQGNTESFTTPNHISSTELTATSARALRFDTGGQSSQVKTGTFMTRVIRKVAL